MEEELEKRLFFNRGSCKCYGNVSKAFLVSDFIFSASSLSSFTTPFIASLSLGTVLIETIERYLRYLYLKINELHKTL